MNKNIYLKTVRETKEKAYRDGVMDGMRMGFNLTAIALNHNKKFRFGEQRLSELESDVQDLVNEIVDTNDPYVTKVRMEKAVRQIRGDKFFEDT